MDSPPQLPGRAPCDDDDDDVLVMGTPPPNRRRLQDDGVQCALGDTMDRMGEAPSYMAGCSLSKHTTDILLLQTNSE